MKVSAEKQDLLLLATAIAAAALIHVSIAASQTVLGIGTALLLVFRGKLDFPRIWVPLICLFLWTALADVVSPDPWTGRAQIKKFFVFLFIPLMYGVFVRQFLKVFYLVIAWTITATASGLLGILQFVQKYRAIHVSGGDFYQTYVGHRITGFEGHWMTFGALQLSVLLVLVAHWFFSDRKLPRWVYLATLVLAAAILLGWTRSIWLAAVPSVLYLIWFWRPKMILLIPVLALVGFFASPHSTRERLLSLFRPRADIDSNEHRLVTFRTGVEMVKAHPVFGLGPEEIGRNFYAYVPKDIPRPLPVGYYGHLHNIYLQYAAERGIPGLACVLWFIGLALWDSFKGIAELGRLPSQQLFVLHAFVAVTIGILVGGIFEYNLGDSEVLMMFVATLGLAYAALRNVTHYKGFSPIAETVSKNGGSDSRSTTAV